MNSIVRAVQKSDDGMERTDWFPASVQPTLPGEYEARTGGGHVFRRKWTSHGWVNSITGLVSKAELDWRGVKPGAVPVDSYPGTLRADLHFGLHLLSEQKAKTLVAQHDAIGLPFA